MRFPLILIRNTSNPCPELITAPWQMGQPGLDVLQQRDHHLLGDNRLELGHFGGHFLIVLGVDTAKKQAFH